MNYCFDSCWLLFYQRCSCSVNAIYWTIDQTLDFLVLSKMYSLFLSYAICMKQMLEIFSETLNIFLKFENIFLNRNFFETLNILFKKNDYEPQISKQINLYNNNSCTLFIKFKYIYMSRKIGVVEEILCSRRVNNSMK